MKSLNNKKGSAIILAIGFGTILFIIMLSLISFTSYRTQTVIEESKKVKALAIAEAGIETAIAELLNNPTFVTHTIKIRNDKLEWDNKKKRENKLEDNSDYDFSIKSGKKGTLEGTLGDGSFKVRVGCIPYQDDDYTKTIDESKAFLKIESIGQFENTYRKIEAVVNKRYPAREFLMYDGGVLSLVYGQTNDSLNKNVFSIGHLYGHQGVEISRILMRGHNPAVPGTTQELDDISAILSGAGGIFFYSDINARFKNRSGSDAWRGVIRANSVFPSSGNGTYSDPSLEEFGLYPDELKNETPLIQEELANWVKDKNSGVNIIPKTPDFKEFKKQAKDKGIFVASNDNSAISCKYRVNSAWTDNGNSLDVAYLDFGSNLRTANIQVPENGIIYSEKDIVIKGNPPKDVKIVSEKNVFVAGDFNQAGDKTRIEQRYGFPQDYPIGKNTLTADNYSDEIQDLYKEDVTARDGAFKHHVAATVIGKERIIYDYRSPVDCFENEIVPFLKYELAKQLCNDDVEAIKCLNPVDTQNLVIPAPDSLSNFNLTIKAFTNKYKIEDADNLIDSLKDIYENSTGSGFDYQKLDDLAVAVWKGYVKDFESDMKGQPSESGMKVEQGIYEMLFNLREKMGGDGELGVPSDPNNIKDEPGDYLYYPEMTTNGMFVSCGKLNNTFYAGPDVRKYYNEIGYSSKTKDFIPDWHHNTKGFIHRLYGSETNLRLYDVRRVTKDQHDYNPPTRRKIYDVTLPQLGTYDDNELELVSYITLSWKDLGSNKKEYNRF